MTEDLRRSIEAEVDELAVDTSLRALARTIGVSHNSLWKLLNGHGMRSGTLLRIQEGLVRLSGRRTATRVRRDLEVLLADLDHKTVARIRRQLRELVKGEFKRAGKTVPRWIGEL